MAEEHNAEKIQNKKYMSVAEMGKLLGLKKTSRYWLLKKDYFRVVTVAGKMWVDVESFEQWYANQLRYHKVGGEEPGKEIKKWTYSVQEIMEILDISNYTVYVILSNYNFDILTVNEKQRISKESFWKWYEGQHRYRTKLDREQDLVKERDTLTMSEAAALLGLDKNGFSKVRNHWYFGELFQYVLIGGRKRITKESFLHFLQNQDCYRYDPTHDDNVSRSGDEYYLNIEQASWAAKVTQDKIMSSYTDGKISAVRAGRQIRIPLSELKTMIAYDNHLREDQAFL